MDEPTSSDDGISGSFEAENAFSTLANETRLSILRALFETDEPLSFSQLRERVGVRDSGQFNYHLGKLTEYFVANTDDGYELRVPGELVLGAVIGGSYEDPDVTVDPIPVEGECPDCGGDIAAGYEEMYLRVTCEDCGLHVLTYPAPPGILHDREREDMPGVFSRYARSVMDQIVGGICPLCFGPTDPDLDSVDAEVPPGLDYRCRRCGTEFSLTVGVTVLDHPDVEAFARDHGIDLSSTPLWELDAFTMADQRRIEDAAVETTISLEDETLVVRLDENLDVVETTRR